MTRHATPEQWAEMEQWAGGYCSTSACLIELRDRIEALEQRPIPGTVELRSSAPAGGLVRQVAWRVAAFASEAKAGDDATPTARAAVLAVAEWLDTRGQHGCSLWLREEVER